jgi:membrane-bound lytic murein transglycosylase D
VFRNFRTKTVAALAGAALLVAGPFMPATAMVDPHDSHHSQTAHDSTFPLQSALEPAVDFWTKVFAEWRRDQVALHDAEHLGVVYRVVQIPGPTGESLTASQRDWVRAQADRLAADLRRLAADHAAKRPLDPQQQKLAASIRRGSGTVSGAADRVRPQRGTRERFLRGLEISGQYERGFRAIFRAQGVPEDLAYLPHVESSFQVGARSTVGAAGIWQFMPSTARSFMTVSRTVDERLNPFAAAQAAARYLSGAHRELGNWPLAVTSYNHGIGSMRRAKSRFGNDFARIVREYDAPSFGFASRNFYPEFLAARRIAKSPQKYFPEGVRYYAPLEVSPVVLKQPLHVQDISRQAGMPLAALAELNPGWADRALKGAVKLPAGISVWIPAEKAIAGFTGPGRTQLAQAASGTHRVAPGESLWSIARRHGTTVASLSVHNDLDPARSHLRVGQVLVLPDSGKTGSSKRSVAATTHRVTAGDTPFAIASTYRVSLSELLAANNLDKRSVIRPGQRLRIPVTD